MQISVTRDGAPWATGTGAITGATGVATYTAKNSLNADYVTTVTAINGGPAPFDGNTPANLFRKGTDASPDADCAGDAPQPSGETAQGAASLRAAIARAAAAKRSQKAKLFGLDGVVGTGVGLGADGDPVIEVYLDRERPATRRSIPSAMGGYATRVIVTGPFVAY